MYNDTIRQVKSDGTVYSTFIGYVEDGKILRASAVQCTGYEGTDKYDYYIRNLAANQGCSLEIILDGGQCFKKMLSELNLPPAYK